MPQPISLAERMKGLGFDPEAERLSLLPNLQSSWNPQDWIAPEWLYGLAKAAVLPGHTAQGGSYTPDDVSDAALNLTGLGAATSFVKPAGALGIFGGKLAKMSPEESDRLRTAQHVRAKRFPEGELTEDVQSEFWKHFGVHFGAEGEPRFEIPDFRSGFNKNAIGGIWPVKQLLQHEELFKRYPDLADFPVHLDPSVRGFGSFTPESMSPEPHIGLQPAANPPERHRTLLHEIQHWVQTKEGHALGGAPEEFATPTSRFVEQQAKLAHEELKQFVRSPENVQRINDFATRLEGALGEVGYDVSNLDTTAIFKALNHASWSEGDTVVIPNVGTVPSNIIRSANRIILEDPVLSFFSDNTAAVAADDAMKAEMFAKYKKLAGEVEARNVESRHLLSTGSRERISPFQSEWWQRVPRNEQQVKLTYDRRD